MQETTSYDHPLMITITATKQRLVCSTNYKNIKDTWSDSTDMSLSQQW